MPPTGLQQLAPFEETPAPARESLLSCASALGRYEGTGRVAGAPAGSSANGRRFESLVDDWLVALAERAVELGAARTDRRLGTRRVIRLERAGRVMHLVTGLEASRRMMTLKAAEARPCAIAFAADHVFAEAPEGMRKLAADTNLELDRAIVRTDGGTVLERMLLEAKSAKGGVNGRLEGNAHERLAWTAFAMAEAHRADPTISLVACLNGAFMRYRSRYPAGFAIMSVRLGELDPTFLFRFFVDAPGYCDLASEQLGWLFGRHVALVEQEMPVA